MLLLLLLLLCMQAVLLVQSIVDCDFFLDLTGDFAELWRLMPEMRNAIDLPTVRSSARHGSGGDDSDSEDSLHGFIAPDVSTHTNCSSMIDCSTFD